MKNIAIVGFMGTGKTTVARKLAEEFKAGYVDIDDEIEKNQKMKIVDIFREKGEAYFRQIEKETVRRFAGGQDRVIACGGGVVIDEENVAALKEKGVIVCLQARPEVILERTKKHGHRPLLNVPDPRAKIEELLRQREKFYCRSDYFVETSELSVAEIVEKIKEMLKDRI